MTCVGGLIYNIVSYEIVQIFTDIRPTGYPGNFKYGIPLSISRIADENRIMILNNRFCV
jgi:hypothetical protein